MIDIAIKPWAATKQIDAIEKRIAGTPEVEIYTWVSKDQALEEFRRQMVTMPSPDAVLDNLPGPGICDGLRILAREENQVDTVKQLFANEPLVDNVEGRYWPSSSGSGSASPAP